MAHITEREGREGRQRPPRRRRMRWVIPVAAAAALAAGAAGFGLTRDVTATTEISCPDAVIDAVTGDPVADCAAHWREQNGTEPPRLVAYDNQAGGIAVVPADAEVPESWEVLGGGARQDRRLIELDAALADYGDGLNRRCYTPDEARPVAARILTRLGLDDWAVRVDDDRPSGDGTCVASHVIDAEAKRVVLIPIESSGPPAGADFVLLARRVQQDVDGKCLSLEDALDTVRRIATGLGIDEASAELVIHSVPDASTDCSRTDVNVGGRIEVTVRGS